ncbi:MAG TPA: hypothetical protein VHB97_07325, partial [Polyangia bacterium]|nr:hypothetical protein [Polyangia bacterium]
AALGVVGCGSGSKADMGTDGGAMMPMCMPDGKAVALTGHYAVRANLLVNVKVVAGCSGSSCIVDNDANAELLLVADLTQNGTSATATVQPCKIVIPPVALKNQPMPVELTVPDALVASVLPVTSTATLGGTSTCASFDAQPITIALGASLANAATDPLPNFTSSASPPVVLCGGMATTACASTANPVGPSQKQCVCDQEGDTKLGATLAAKNAPGFEDIDQVYVDLRTSVTLSGQVYPGQQIRGTVQGLELEQNVLGCHRSNAPGARDCLDTETNTVAGFNPAVTQSVNGSSTFVVVPVAAGTTCDQIKAMEATLFP